MSTVLVSVCQKSYQEWSAALLRPFDEDNPPRLITASLYQSLLAIVDPEVVAAARERDSIEEEIERGSSVSERNALRERIIREVAGFDVLNDLEPEPVRRRIRSVLIDLIMSLQLEDMQSAIDLFEANFAPRAWHWVKDCEIRGLCDVSHITHLDTEKGGKITSVSPRELAFAVGLLDFTV